MHSSLTINQIEPRFKIRSIEKQCVFSDTQGAYQPRYFHYTRVNYIFYNSFTDAPHFFTRHPHSSPHSTRIAIRPLLIKLGE